MNHAQIGNIPSGPARLSIQARLNGQCSQEKGVRSGG